MAKDHYVSQTYLDSFTNEQGFLTPYFKEGRVIVGKPKAPKSVCYKEDGSTNSYLQEPRALEEYLIPLENYWQRNLQSLRNKTLKPEERLQIAQYLSFLRASTPTAVRQSQERLSSVVHSTAQVMAGQGLFNNEKYSSEQNEKYIDAYLKGTFEIDEEYAHVRNLETMDYLVTHYCVADWMVLLSPDKKFLTSDNPLCLYYPIEGNSMISSHYVPLAPEMALLIIMNPEYSDAIKQKQSKIPLGQVQGGTVKTKLVRDLNENLIRRAEKKVFYNQKVSWVEKLVSENKSFKAASLNDVIPTDGGIMNIMRDLAVPKD